MIIIFFSFFAPVALRVVGLLGSFWSTPVITWEPVLREVVGEQSYDDVISTYGAFEDYAQAAVAVIRHLKWTKIALVIEDTPLCMTLMEELHRDMLEGNVAKEVAQLTLQPGNTSSLGEELRRIKQLTRSSLLNVVLQLGQFHNTQRRDGRAQEEEVPQDTEILSAYLHDAVVVATVASQRDIKDFSPRNLSIAAPFKLKTGSLDFDEQGIRKAKFSLVQRQGAGKMVTVAEVTSNQNVTVLNEILWDGGHVPISEITCSANDSCMDVVGIIAGVTVGVFTVFLLVALAGYFYRRHRRRLAAAKKDWLVDDRDVKRRRAKLPMTNGFSSGAGSNMETVKRLVRMETRGTLGLGSNCSLDKNMLYAPIGNYKDMVVAVKHVRWTHVQMGKREMLEDLTTVKQLSHDNVNQFVGAYVSTEPGNSYVLFRYCSKGSLQDVLANGDIKLDWMFKLSFALDLAKGIEYIHKTALRSHGNLKSSNCVIDSRWVLKVTDYGAITSYRKPGSEDDLDNRVYFSSLLWTAPELLRMSKRPHKGTQKGDVYSFGIILQEILFRCAAYFHNYMEPEDIIILVKNESHHRTFRPVIPLDNELPPKAINLMVACWSDAPEARPDIHQIRKRVRDLNGSKRFNIMDNMLQMLESYSSNLEQLVTDRTEELEAEKRKTDTLLYQMLPPFAYIWNYQYYIFFSFLKVVDLLNDLYTCFDEVIVRRDVYKVETIGDAYMCASGCPRRNGNRHAGEIANMALDLISAMTHFRIRHKPEEQLNLRVGLHTGPCAAGVVGRTMPRYCLFGDTVNMASWMESTGKG
ncbi:guanylate cyclase [Plakobranchus ocellatus]|uniref:Guanylate cyclase n=1 Tax=Plakobranchus ocellatus TaxID=259542 RepID=A0AAV4DA81_9GAST|nr:guanylate cyclase [Plakobranchus ocellatus]